MFSTSPLDWGLILLYFGFLAAVWAGAFGRRLGALEYLVAGRRVTLPALVATLVATWYGGILGVGEYSWRYGIANWLVFGVPYYIGALLFAAFFAKRARDARLYTLPDLLDRAYGRGPALVGALAVFIVAQPAAYVLMLGTLFATMFGLPLAPCILGAALLSVFYIDKGGLRAVVFTDQVQFVLMYLGFALILVFLVAQHGALPFLRAHLPPSHFTWHGGNPPQAIFVWYFIALSALVDPGFWQRAYAARDPKVARDAVLWSVVCWAVFDFMTTMTGLYARALLPAAPGPRVRLPRGGAHHAPAVRARPLLPRHDRHRDEHDRFLRLHRRGHRGPRHRLAHRARRRGPRAGLDALRPVARRRPSPPCSPSSTRAWSRSGTTWARSSPPRCCCRWAPPCSSAAGSVRAGPWPPCSRPSASRSPGFCSRPIPRRAWPRAIRGPSNPSMSGSPPRCSSTPRAGSDRRRRLAR